MTKREAFYMTVGMSLGWTLAFVALALYLHSIGVS